MRATSQTALVSINVGTINVGSIALGLLIAVAVASPAIAQRIDTSARIENGVAVFAALDKVTARISKLEVPLGETVKFGALKVTPRSCFTRQPTEPPKTTTFVEVQEIQLDGQEKKIFAGWMFAESPGLNAVEHPVYDVWLTECSKPKTVAAPAAPVGRPTPAAKGGQPPASSGTVSGAQPVDGDLQRRRPPR
jgi:hypothetical protein